MTLFLLNWLAGAFNVALFIYLAMLIYKCRRLNHVLDAICFQSLVAHHVPVWQPWCRMRGLNFMIQTYPAERG